MCDDIEIMAVGKGSEVVAPLLWLLTLVGVPSRAASLMRGAYKERVAVFSFLELAITGLWSRFGGIFGGEHRGAHSGFVSKFIDS